MINSLKMLALVMTLITTAIPASGYDFQTHDAGTYILEKSATHDIVFLGTTHQQPAILDFIADILPRLHTAGITHVALEVGSDQQARIDRYLNSGLGLADIVLHRAIDCPRYRRLFMVLRGLKPHQRPDVVAIDLPIYRYSGPVGRDAYMADKLEGIVTARTDNKVLAILGSFHVLRELRWLKRVSNGHEAIRACLARRHPGIRMFSAVHIVSHHDPFCDFDRRLGPVHGAVAVDLHHDLADWHLGLTASLAIQPTPIWRLLDGVIVH